MESVKLKLNKICRTCLSEAPSMKSLLSKLKDDERTLLEVLCSIANTNFKIGNKLPDQVCSDCEVTLYKTEAFKRNCIESESILNKILRDEDISDNMVSPFNANSPEDFVEMSPSHLDNSCSIEIEVKTEESFEVNIKQEISIKGPRETFERGSDRINNFVTESNECDNKESKICDCNSRSGTINGNIKHVSSCKFSNLKNEKKVLEEPDNAHTKCNQVFNSIQDLETYLKNEKDVKGVRSEKKYECSMCMHKFSKKCSYISHTKKHKLQDEGKYTCATCKREFKHLAHLDNHIMSVHTRDKGFTCEHCMKSFFSKDSLENHKELHVIQKKYQCKICKKAFSVMSTLTEHMRIHTGEKPHLCSICGKGFSQKSNLAQHMRRHQGLKPFKCESCDQSFVSKGELDSHSRRHSGVHPFVCDDCGGGFTTSSSLVKHRRIHTGERPYACDICTMKFRASGTLKIHKRTHTNEKPYQCSYCEKAFAQKNDLVSHIRCHTGERPYICATCGLSFRKSYLLKAHFKTHNKESVHINLSVLQGVNF